MVLTNQIENGVLFLDGNSLAFFRGDEDPQYREAFRVPGRY